ncbi:LCP family protein [Patescibacteria group bacterium]|nr:LCP family protein [Patescibacteria group bacterium]
MVYCPPEKQFDIERIVNQTETENENSLRDIQRKRKKISPKKILMFLGIFILIVLISGGYMVYRANSTFDKITGKENSVIMSFIKMLPMGDNFFQVFPQDDEKSTIEKLKNNELDRLNILLLGIRGVGDPNGGLLTDTMIIVSLKPNTEQLALISIPRDLYVEIPHRDDKNKINEVFVNGVQDGGWEKGFEYSKKTIKNVSSLDIHYVVSVDFDAFKEIVDTLGGVKITLNRPFSETNQFEEGIIKLPAGTQIIDGDTALLYARARFSSSDFDRSKRQQQLLLGIKEKAFSLGVVSNPVKILTILDSLGNHIKTDAELWEIKELADVFRKTKANDIRKKVFDTSKEGLLYASRDAKGSYILLPEGDNFEKMQEAARNIFN